MMKSDVAFPITVTFEDGTTETYDNAVSVECDLEYFDSKQATGCSVVDAHGRRLRLKVDMLELQILELEQ